MQLIRFVPCDGFTQSLFERCSGGESQHLLRPAHVQAAAGLAVGLGGVPDDFACERARSRDQFRQVLMVISRPLPRLMGSGESYFSIASDQAVGAVFDIEKFAAGRCRCPRR